jgi:hypothetical protein
MAKKRQSDGLRRFNYLLHQVSVLEKTVEPKYRLSIAERRKLVKQELYPAFKTGKTYKRAGKKAVNDWFANRVDLIDAWLSSRTTEDLINIEFWLVTDKVREMPAGVFAKVTTRDFGETEIFNTDQRDYFIPEIDAIKEAIREAVENKSDFAYFDGIRRIMPDAEDDGDPNSYYIDLVLTIETSTGGTDFQGDPAPKIKGTKKKKNTKAQVKKLKENAAKQRIKYGIRQIKNEKKNQKNDNQPAKKKITQTTELKRIKTLENQLKTEKQKRIKEQKDFQKQIEAMKKQLAQLSKKINNGRK